jgi:hypothetical protein
MNPNDATCHPGSFIGWPLGNGVDGGQPWVDMRSEHRAVAARKPS